MSIGLPHNICTRMAPTPSGYLHIGNMLNFALTWLIARAMDGIVHLRIDDLDQARFRQEYLEDIFESLDWLGMDWDEGPSGPGQQLSTFSQRHNLLEYREILTFLSQQEDAVFACAKSRNEVLQASTAGQYPLAFREQALPLDQEGLAWRVKTPKPCPITWDDLLMGSQTVDLYQEMRDFVVLRKDGLPAYQIASLADDEANEINFIVRGEDLRMSSAAQLFLAHTLNFEQFPTVVFMHHPVLVGRDAQKLSKSQGAMSLKYMREEGMPIGEVLGFMAQVFGLPAYSYSCVEDLWDAFDPNNLQWKEVPLTSLTKSI